MRPARRAPRQRGRPALPMIPTTTASTAARRISLSVRGAAGAQAGPARAVAGLRPRSTTVAVSSAASTARRHSEEQEQHLRVRGVAAGGVRARRRGCHRRVRCRRYAASRLRAAPVYLGVGRSRVGRQRVVAGGVDLGADQFGRDRGEAGRTRCASWACAEHHHVVRRRRQVGRRRVRRPSGTASSPAGRSTTPSTTTSTGASPPRADLDGVARGHVQVGGGLLGHQNPAVGADKGADLARETARGSPAGCPSTIPGPVVWVLRPVGAMNPVEWANPTGSALARAAPTAPCPRPAVVGPPAGPRPASRQLTLATARVVIERLGGGEKAAQTRQQRDGGGDAGGRRGQPATSATQLPERPRPDHVAPLIAVGARVQPAVAHRPPVGETGGDDGVVGGDDQARHQWCLRCPTAH